MSKKIKNQTEYFIKDLHARESMRLSWYRHFPGGENIQRLRAQKARHQAFLHDLLRRRALHPIWYARVFYLAGHVLGLITALLPAKWSLAIERTLESWLFMRYDKYLKRLRLHFDVRSMIEAMQMRKLNHDEPGTDVLALLENFVEDQRGHNARALEQRDS